MNCDAIKPGTKVKVEVEREKKNLAGVLNSNGTKWREQRSSRARTGKATGWFILPRDCGGIIRGPPLARLNSRLLGLELEIAIETT